MPLNVCRFGAVWFSVLISCIGVFAQAPTSGAPNTSAPNIASPTLGAPTSGDIMRDRVKKAKALVAVKNYNAAIYELEGIRKESNEPAVNSVAQVMLMNCYLEQSDYKRAQALLTDIFNARKTNRFGGENYYMVAGQVVKGAKVQADRYKSLGLMVSDANLPLDAVADINKMRETVELVITESKALGSTQKETSSAMALLEEATGARGVLARDDFDAKRWKDEVADARDGLVNSKGVVDAVGDGNVMNTVASANPTPGLSTPSETSPIILPVADKTNNQLNSGSTTAAVLKTDSAMVNTPLAKPELSQSQVSKTDKTTEKNVPPTPNQDTTAANAPKTSSRARKIENKPEPTANTSINNTVAENTVKSDSPLTIGSLLEYATAKVQPTYPPAAKTTRTMGTVRVELVVDEDGKPEVQNASGPGMLKQAAQDAVKRWKFKPFTRDGQPVKATGYVNFNFNL